MDKQFDDELKGVFFKENQAEVMWTGNMTKGGEKGYYRIVQSENRDGKKKLELMKSVGLIYATSEEEKTSPNSPDFGGRVTVDKDKLKFGSWLKLSASGIDYLSASFKKIDEEDEAPF
tara:strand:+ start:6076 stop:6429 length:354 start_codon:yes stop_codon:yes gene_type:complete